MVGLHIILRVGVFGFLGLLVRVLFVVLLVFLLFLLLLLSFLFLRVIMFSFILFRVFIFLHVSVCLVLELAEVLHVQFLISGLPTNLCQTELECG